MYDNIIIGQWIGISHKVVSNMFYWLFTVSWKLIARTNVQHVICTDLLDPEMKGRIDYFDENL